MKNKNYLHNPHSEDFIYIPLGFWLFKKKALKKYWYIRELDYDIYIDCTTSSLIPTYYFNKLPSFLRVTFLKVEIFFWKKINKINNKVFYDEVEIGNSNILSFSFRNFKENFGSRQNKLRFFNKIVCHMTHFMLSTNVKSKNIKSLENKELILLAESNLKENSKLFKDHFDFDFRFEVLPFLVQERFKILKEYSERKNLAICTGTYHNLSFEPEQESLADFFEAYNIDTYHPGRALITDNKKRLSGFVDVRTSLFRAGKVTNRFGLLGKIVNTIKTKQSDYLKFDIVSLYNDYKYAVVPEEIHGLPGIGSFEAMMCGCILITENPFYYTELGMQENVHFVTYSGEIESLISVIEKLNSEDCSHIGINASTYLKSLLSKESLLDKLKNIIEG